jgi:hypothetical protein
LHAIARESSHRYLNTTVTASAHTSTCEPSTSVTIQWEGGPATSSMKTDLSGVPCQL